MTTCCVAVTRDFNEGGYGKRCPVLTHEPWRLQDEVSQ